jgi:ComF family protein
MLWRVQTANSLSEFAQGIKHLFFPSLCEGCRKPLVGNEEIICIGCELHLGKTNYHHIAGNETALRLSGRVPFRHASSFAYFMSDGLMQHLIHGLKYKGKRANGVFLGKELGKSIEHENWQIDMIVPVPLHKKKLALRGYNQSEEIALGLASVLKVPVVASVLERVRATESQTDKTREQRISNVAGAFSLKKQTKLTGKHLLLVDDVLTTGATVEACALTLLSVPGVTVSIVTTGIAR